MESFKPIPELIELLSRDAALVDESLTIPPSHFDAFAAAGLYGAFAPKDVGGLELGFTEACDLVEQLAAACLTTTFVWLQHFRLLSAVLDPATPEDLRSMLPLVIGGQVKGGISLGGLLPGPARLTAEVADDGWLLNGDAPWVSGWGTVDKLVVTAREGTSSVASFVLDASLCEGLTVTPVRLSAMNASSTVTVAFSNVKVPHDRYVGSQPYAPGLERPEGLRVNGSLALGVTRRCCDLIGPSVLDDELRSTREELNRAGVDEIHAARARASTLAVRCAHVLAVSTGSRSAISGDVAERSTREASLLLVFASRPAIKMGLLERMFNES
ncbi:MAG TPA: acyl-CoA dehydrogenase family protein [Acidimicrobiales bacterium]|nr:acyl-CoA dehydrogenase family protein [Acidimicrobiales bacterium]